MAFPITATRIKPVTTGAMQNNTPTVTTETITKDNLSIGTFIKELLICEF